MLLLSVMLADAGQTRSQQAGSIMPKAGFVADGATALTETYADSLDSAYERSRTADHTLSPHADFGKRVQIHVAARYQHAHFLSPGR
jgi:hypothetical protein